MSPLRSRALFKHMRFNCTFNLWFHCVIFFSFLLSEALLSFFFPLNIFLPRALLKLLNICIYENRQIVLSFSHLHWSVMQIKFILGYLTRNIDYPCLSGSCRLTDLSVTIFPEIIFQYLTLVNIWRWMDCSFWSLNIWPCRYWRRKRNHVFPSNLHNVLPSYVSTNRLLVALI